MTISTTVFWVLAVITVVGAACAMTLRNIVHCVLSVILFFFGIAGLFILLHAEFIAALQILVYVGAVGVLLVMAILLTRHITGNEGGRELAASWWAGFATAIAVAATLIWAVAMALPKLAPFTPHAQATTREIGEVMMTRFVLPVEIVAVLLTAAMIGAIVIAMEEITKKK